MAHLANANNSFLWTIVCAYYSMFYIANAILYSYGYKVGSKIAHKVTADALIVHIRNKLNKSILDQYEEVQKQALNFMNANDLVLQFDLEREKRNRVQYSTTELIKNAKAKTSLERAKRFYTEMRKLII
ncbi:hypothetical protein HOK51_09030 [Candidatus Woesearchaeota archaeon]|jgi:uncharacterized protein (UPF0332 family)|nr:hypothetical protein [Candidatus Woesearchaeota archaeon]MBT6519972.1 hypothetical protein [Candidatus Woesearchaeota archaeon]MBT7367827.1 hypothetical protein [Candidatus Woesearchaeota archaeon]